MSGWSGRYGGSCTRRYRFESMISVLVVICHRSYSKLLVDTRSVGQREDTGESTLCETQQAQVTLARHKIGRVLPTVM